MEESNRGGLTPPLIASFMRVGNEKMKRSSSKPSCPKCSVLLKPGVAARGSWVGMGDFGQDDVVTIYEGGVARLIPCLKCPNCGYSITEGKSNAN